MPHFWKTTNYYTIKSLTYFLSRMTSSEIRNIGKIVYQETNNKFKPAFDVFVGTLYEASNSHSLNPEKNGEYALLDRIGKLDFSTYFDVGANVGDWTKRALVSSSGVHVHCFEIVPDTFSVLSKQLAFVSERVTLNSVGLSDKPGKVDVHLFGGNLISSVYNVFVIEDKNTESGTLECAVITGDDYIKEKETLKIDFLKIDVEGAEGDVLNGLSDAFVQHKIRLVQFEYNKNAIASKFLLVDFYKFFIAKDYVIGLVTPDGIEFRDYYFEHENFFDANFVACGKDDNELINFISVPGL